MRLRFAVDPDEFPVPEPHECRCIHSFEFTAEGAATACVEAMSSVHGIDIHSESRREEQGLWTLDVSAPELPPDADWACTAH